MNNLQQHHVEYLASQLDDDDFGVDICLQHLSGQELLQQKRIFERPSHANTPRVYRMAAIGTLIVTGAAFITATVVPTILYAIPAYLAYVALTLGIRKTQLA
jgi:uncharacterized membrane protein YdbT with pleckstrin-like domain